MKIILTLLFLTGPLVLVGQELKCCDSEENIKSILNGSWRLKHSDYNSYFNYSFSEVEGSCKIIQDHRKDTDSKLDILCTGISVIKDSIGYTLKWDAPLFYWTAKIKKLRSSKMILESNGASIEFIKD